LSTLFWWLTIWAYLSFLRRRHWTNYAWLVGALAIGLMSKPMLVTVPFVLLLLDFWPLGRLGAGLRGLGQLVTEKLPLVGLVVASSIITVLAQHQGGAVVQVQRLPLDARVSNAVVSYLLYLQKTLWPVGLSVFYPFPHQIPIALVLGSAAVLFGITAIAWMARRQFPYILVGWSWFIITLVPVIGLVQVGSQAMADRYMYVPMVGLLITAAWGASEFSRRWAIPRFILPVMGSVMVLVLGGVCADQPLAGRHLLVATRS